MKKNLNFEICHDWLLTVDEKAAEYYSLNADKEAVKYGELWLSISGGFSWSDTKQGFDYWSSLHNRFLKFLNENQNSAIAAVLVNPVKPKHYNENEDYDVYSFAIKNNLGMLEGNVIKYVSRHGKKNGKEDLLKAIETLERLIREKY